jgi:methyl-accepting chemotaxis protein-1 (serine sensor receptor)
MNFNNFGIRARITLGLSVILLLTMLSAAHSLYQNISVKYEASLVQRGVSLNGACISTQE